MLTDFGFAKGRAYTVLTKPGQVLGTIDYLAPEMILGEPGTTASDIYALGCVAFECAVGRAPFADKGLFQVSLAHLEEQPPDPAPDDPAFSVAILAALQKDPGARPASAGEYATLVRKAVDGEAPA